MTADGITTTTIEFRKLYSMTLIFCEDGIVSLSTVDPGGWDTDGGTWSATGNKIIITDGDEPVIGDFSNNGNILTIQTDQNTEWNFNNNN